MKKIYTRKSFEKELANLGIRVADTAKLTREGFVSILELQKIQERYIEMYDYYLRIVCTADKKLFKF